MGGGDVSWFISTDALRGATSQLPVVSPLFTAAKQVVAIMSKTKVDTNMSTRTRGRSAMRHFTGTSCGPPASNGDFKRAALNVYQFEIE
jgi:hypothetical protein